MKKLNYFLAAIAIVVVAFVIGSFVDMDSIAFISGSASMLAVAPLVWIKEGIFSPLSSEDFEKLTDEEKMKYANDLQAHRNKQIEDLSAKIKALEGNTEKIAELEAFKSELKGLSVTALKEAVNAIKIQGEELRKMKESGTITESSFKSILKNAWDENLENIEKAITGKGSHEIELKATQTYGDITSGSDYAQMRTEITDKPVRMPKIRSLFRTLPVTTEFFKYPEQETVIRDAQNVALCAAVTSTTKETIVVNSIQTKKIKDMIDFCVDFISDYPFMESRVRKLIEESITLKVDSDLLLADGTGNNPFSIDYYSSEFSALNPVADVSASIKDANYVDLIGSMETQIVELGEQGAYMPDTVLVNKVDWFREVESYKDADNNYMDTRIQNINGMPFYKGMRVVWTPLVAQNTLYVFDSTKAEVVDRQSLTLEVAYENKDNWEKELGTLKGYVRLNLLVETNNQNAFMKCSDVATAIAAIKKP